jgi:hypothetical protein
MANLTLRASTSATNPGSTTAKGSALTYGEMDSNLILLNNEKIQLTSLSVGSEGTASGNGSIAYNNTTGVFTYTPPTASGISAISSLSADGSPSLGGNLDVGTRIIYTNNTNGNVTLAADGTGKIQLNSSLSISTGNISTNTTNGNLTLTANGTGKINLNSPVVVSQLASYTETIYSSDTTTGTYAPNPADGSIVVVTLTGNMTINDMTSPTAGDTVTIIFDGTGGTYTLTLGAKILKAGGNGTLTPGGIDILTLTCVDDTSGDEVYAASLVNNFS